MKSMGGNEIQLIFFHVKAIKFLLYQLATSKNS